MNEKYGLIMNNDISIEDIKEIIKGRRVGLIISNDIINEHVKETLNKNNITLYENVNPDEIKNILDIVKNMNTKMDKFKLPKGIKEYKFSNAISRGIDDLLPANYRNRISIKARIYDDKLSHFEIIYRDDSQSYDTEIGKIFIDKYGIITNIKANDYIKDTKLNLISDEVLGRKFLGVKFKVDIYDIVMGYLSNEEFEEIRQFFK